MKRKVKSIASLGLAALFRSTRKLRRNFQQLRAHALLSGDLLPALPVSVVVLGKASVFGTGNVRFGENVMLYSDLHLETYGDAAIEVGDDVVISRGTHIVARAGVTIGKGAMIGEYASIRDANHARDPDRSIRESRHRAKPITIGRQVWIGRGAAVLSGVTIGDDATVGANAVVTRDVPAGATVVGAPARPVPAAPPRGSVEIEAAEKGLTECGDRSLGS